LAGRGGEGQGTDGDKEFVAAGKTCAATSSYNTMTTCWSSILYGQDSGALQRRTEAGGYHRPASASYGRKATLLNLYFLETKKSEGKIFGSSHDAGPSGSSPAPVSVLWRSNSTATFRRGAELEGPDCFSHNLSGVFSVKTQTFFQNSPVL
jgi:hypothetical protein